MKVRDVMKRLKQDGWYEVRMKGSHRVFQHTNKPGIVVLSGNMGHEIATGTLKAIWRQAQLEDRQ